MIHRLKLRKSLRDRIQDRLVPGNQDEELNPDSWLSQMYYQLDFPIGSLEVQAPIALFLLEDSTDSGSYQVDQAAFVDSSEVASFQSIISNLYCLSQVLNSY